MDDNDLILETYSEYLKDEPEWPNFHNVSDHKKYTNRYPEDIPLLIRECFRLTPVKNKVTGYYEFHARNMPTVRLKKFRLIGKIMRLENRTDNMELKVYDGTGFIQVFHRKKQGQANKNRANLVDRREVGKVKANVVPVIADTTRQKVFDDGTSQHSTKKTKPSQHTHDEPDREKCDQSWSVETLKVGDYVTAVGYLNIRLTKNRSETERHALWARNMISPIFLRTYLITPLTEKEYLDTCTELIEGIFKQKYTAD